MKYSGTDARSGCHPPGPVPAQLPQPPWLANAAARLSLPPLACWLALGLLRNGNILAQFRLNLPGLLMKATFRYHGPPQLPGPAYQGNVSVHLPPEPGLRIFTTLRHSCPRGGTPSVLNPIPYTHKL